VPTYIVPAKSCQRVMRRLKLILIRVLYEYNLRRIAKFDRKNFSDKETFRKIKLAIEEALHENKKRLKSLLLLFFIQIVTVDTSIILAQPPDLITNIFKPFRDAIALLFAIAFGIGLLGFFFIVFDAVVSWVTGGSFGRSLAVSKFLRAVETLAIIPLLFLLVNIMKNIGINEISAIADIFNTLLNEGWKIIISVFTG